MVRLINKNNLGFVTNAVFVAMKFQEYFTRISNVNYQDVGPCIYAMWHADQFCIHGIPKRDKLNVLISNSFDGEIISGVVQKLGFQVVRGSTGRKGSVAGTMQIVDKLKAGESVAMMVDGPRGPAKVVKGGVVKIARMAGVPIVPVHWYSPQWNFVTLPSWDKMQTPILLANIINLYGNPISVEGAQESDEAMYMKLIQNSLLDLERRLPDMYEEVKSQLRWAIRKE